MITNQTTNQLRWKHNIRRSAEVITIVNQVVYSVEWHMGFVRPRIVNEMSFLLF